MKSHSVEQPEHWLEIGEVITVTGAVGGSLMSILLKQFLWVTIPLSASAVFTLLNHQKFKQQIKAEKQVIASLIRENETKIAELKSEHQQKYQENKAGVMELDSELAEVRKLATTELARLKQEGQASLQTTTTEIAVLQVSVEKLQNLNQKLEADLTEVTSKQQETSHMVKELKAIDICSQDIHASLNSIQSYFERGFAYQRLGNKHRAIDDYSKTIELDRNHAQAHHNRGTLYAEMNINQKAILDLRRASKLYFDQGNLEKYRETRDLSQNIHDNQPDNHGEDTTARQDSHQERVVVNTLFS